MSGDSPALPWIEELLQNREIRGRLLRVARNSASNVVERGKRHANGAGHILRQHLADHRGHDAAVPGDRVCGLADPVSDEPSAECPDVGDAPSERPRR